MKTYVSEDDFQQVLALLGLPGETLSIEIGDRGRWIFPGAIPGARWAMRAVISVPGSYDGDHNMLAPYEERVVYVAVQLPGDEKHRLALQTGPSRRRAEIKFGRRVEDVTLPETGFPVG